MQQHAVHATLFMQSLSRAHQNYCYQESQREAVPAMCKKCKLVSSISMCIDFSLVNEW